MKRRFGSETQITQALLRCHYKCTSLTGKSLSSLKLVLCRVTKTTIWIIREVGSPCVSSGQLCSWTALRVFFSAILPSYRITTSSIRQRPNCRANTSTPTPARSLKQHLIHVSTGATLADGDHESCPEARMNDQLPTSKCSKRDESCRALTAPALGMHL